MIHEVVVTRLHIGWSRKVNPVGFTSGLDVVVGPCQAYQFWVEVCKVGVIVRSAGRVREKLHHNTFQVILDGLGRISRGIASYEHWKNGGVSMFLDFKNEAHRIRTSRNM